MMRENKEQKTYWKRGLKEEGCLEKNERDREKNSNGVSREM